MILIKKKYSTEKNGKFKDLQKIAKWEKNFPTRREIP